MDQPSISGTKQYNDFRLELKPVTLLRNAVAALSDTQLNPLMSGLLVVRKTGFAITVHDTMPRAGTEVDAFGYLCLEAEKLDQFECRNTIRKMISLEDVGFLLNAAQDDDAVIIYSQHGSDLLSFVFDSAVNDHSPGTPLVVGLEEVILVDSSYQNLPTITYALKVKIPAAVLTQMITRVLDQEARNRPEDITMNIRPGTVRVQAGTYVLETLTTEEIEAWLTWPFWEALSNAIAVADYCSLYLVTEPNDHFMLKFDVGEVGHLVFLKGEYIGHSDNVDELYRFGHFSPITED